MAENPTIEELRKARDELVDDGVLGIGPIRIRLWTNSTPVKTRNVARLGSA